MTRNEYCSECKKPVVGLYRNNRKNKNDPSKQWIRSAFYCKHCNLVLKDNEVVYKKIIYEKREE